MNTGRSSKQTTCLCRDTGGKGTLRAQRTGFNTLDNWGHKTPTQSKRKRNRKEKVKGSWPETCIQYTRLHKDAICLFHSLWQHELILNLKRVVNRLKSPRVSPHYCVVGGVKFPQGQGFAVIHRKKTTCFTKTPQVSVSQFLAR